MNANAVQRLLDGSNAVGSYPHYRATCRLHDDARLGGNPSFEIDFVNRVGVVDIYGRCRSCGANALDLANALGIDWPDIQYAMPAFVAGHPEIASRPWPLPSDAQFAEWNKKLLKGGEALDWMTRERGISIDVIRRLQIGWWPERRWVMFPIVDTFEESSPFIGQYVRNALWYPTDSGDDGRRKMCCWGGHPTDLYPGEPTTTAVLVTEGELDALAALSAGISAVSGTTGAGRWDPRWTPAFAGRHVVISYDCDDAGRAGARTVAAELVTVAQSVKVIDLDPDQTDGYDLTDWFKAGRTKDEIGALIRRHKYESPGAVRSLRSTNQQVRVVNSLGRESSGS